MFDGNHIPRSIPTRWSPPIWCISIAFGVCSAACDGDAPERAIENREVTTACGRCVFGLPEATVGCPWAVEIDGRRYLVQGRVPEGHQNHAPDGICNMPRRAVVDGRIRGDKFISTRFELKPAEKVPQKPRFTPKDEH